MENNETAEPTKHPDDRWERVQDILDVIHSVRAAISEATCGKFNTVFRLNEPYYSNGVFHGTPELQENEIFIDDVLKMLPDLFRERNLGVFEITQIQGSLNSDFSVLKKYDLPWVPGFGSTNGDIASLALGNVVDEYFDEIARNEINGRDLADAYIYAKERAMELEGDLAYGTYCAAFQRLSAELARKVEIETERIQIAHKLKQEIGSNSEPVGVQKPKVIRTRRRDIPADRIGLFFYYFFEATNSTGIREDKAKVVSQLTQFSASTIKAMLSNHLANEDKDSFENDFKTVMAMFKMIGFSDAYDLMKRDKKRE